MISKLKRAFTDEQQVWRLSEPKLKETVPAISKESDADWKYRKELSNLCTLSYNRNFIVITVTKLHVFSSFQFEFVFKSCFVCKAKRFLSRIPRRDQTVKIFLKPLKVLKWPRRCRAYLPRVSSASLETNRLQSQQKAPRMILNKSPLA